MAADDRPIDLVAFGVTSFIGEIQRRHLSERHGVDRASR